MLITAPSTRSTVRKLVRPWWSWIATAFSFPPAGFLAHEVAGPVDDVGSALLAGLIAGAVIGTAQWAVLRRRGASPRWIVATAAGFGAGLAAGAVLVGYETSLAALAVMGFVCGAAMAVGQAASLGALRRHARCWTFSTAALWAIGWSVTTVAGVDVDDQWAVFGISGALVVATLQSVLVNRLVPVIEADRAMADDE